MSKLHSVSHWGENEVSKVAECQRGHNSCKKFVVHVVHFWHQSMHVATDCQLDFPSWSCFCYVWYLLSLFPHYYTLPSSVNAIAHDRLMVSAPLYAQHQKCNVSYVLYYTSMKYCNIIGHWRGFISPVNFTYTPAKFHLYTCKFPVVIGLVS